MKNSRLVVISCVFAGFCAGALVSRTASWPKDHVKQVLYYVDPMHPSYRSDRPGIAPDCGMPLEPVYAGGPIPTADPIKEMPPGTVHVSADRQMAIGVKIGQVEDGGGSSIVRLVGRVTPDERRIYRLTAAAEGWIQSIAPITTGTQIRKHQTLLTFYAPEFLAAEQAYLFALGSLDRFKSAGKETPDQLRLTNVNIQNYRNSLRNLGMSDHQLDEIAKNRELTEQIRVEAPAGGFILARNVSVGQKFEKGTEFFRIADISRVWIVLDTYGTEAQHLQPGKRAIVKLPGGRQLSARVSSTLPQFDAASRSTRIRLEAENPGYILRPDMFVEAEIAVSLPAGITVPAEAVLDSGTRKTVFVDRGNGYFEPRAVETGAVLDERIEIRKGLKAGEKIVVSGNFLLDSETRLRYAAAGITGNAARDPVCGMEVDEGRAAAASLQCVDGQTTYSFCSTECRDKFGHGRDIGKRKSSGPVALQEVKTEAVPAVHSAATTPGKAVSTKGPVPHDKPHH